MRVPTLAIMPATAPVRAQVSGPDLAAAELPAVEQLMSGAWYQGRLPGYSDMWQIQFVQVGEGFQPGSSRDCPRALADAQAGRFRLVDAEVVVSGPVIYVDGRPAAR